MRARLAMAAVAGAAALIPVGSADATLVCTPTPTTAGIDVNVCADLVPEPGGYSTSASISVFINGGRTAFCVARITITTGGVSRDPRTVYAC